MSFREITMQDVRELLRRHEAGQSARLIAREMGMDRKTVGRYLEAAQRLVPATETVTDEVAGQVGRRVQARPAPTPSKAWRALEGRRSQISGWLGGERPLRLVRVHELLARDGLTVGYLLIMAAFLIMAIQAFLAVLEYYVILAVAGVLIPWGVLPQTKFLAEKAIGAVVSAGIKLMVLAFIIAVVDPVLASIHFSGPEIKLNELWSVLLTAAAIAFLAWHVPSLTAGLLAGSPSLSASGVAQNVSAGTMLAAGVAGGMVAATRAAANGASALGQRAAYGAGVLFGGARKAPQNDGNPVASTLAAGKGAAGAAGRSAVDGLKARVSRAAAPFRDSFRAGAEKAVESGQRERPKR
jgi:hypothetical protein